jgi:putative transposase
MQGSKRNISKKQIELEIYKTFEQFKESKNTSIANFLNKLNLENLIPTRYRAIKYSYHSLIRLLIFQQLKGIKFKTQLIKYLKQHRTERFKLGFSKTPDRTTIGYFINHILDAETKDTLNFVAKKIEKISEKFDILLDVKTLQPEKPKQQPQERNYYQKKRDKTREISRLFKKRFASVLDLNLYHNATYTKNMFIDLLFHMCKTNDFAENGSKTFKEERKQVPTGETLLYHLKNYQSIDQIKRMFMTYSEMIWETARKARLFNDRSKVDVAVDFTEWHYYGNKNAPMVMDKKPEQGAAHCYKFATIDIVERDKRFTLLALPYGPFDRSEDILRTLLSYASQRIKINRVLVDRGFFDSKLIEIFNRYHVKFLMPCPMNSRIKKILEITPTPRVIKDYVMGMTKFNIVVVEDDQGINRAFATNIEFNENDVGLSERIFMIYGKRWGIETGYRVKKHSYRSKTTSKNYFIRLFYFLFSVLLYNLWLLIDNLLWLSLFGFVREKHLLRSKYFVTILITITVDPGG